MPAFIDYGLREQDFHICSKACCPRIKRLADLDWNRNGEIICSIWNQHGVLAELLQNHICQVVGTAELYCRFRSGEHMEYLGLVGVQVDVLERFCALSWLWIDSDVLHSVNAEMAEFLAVVGIEIVISVVPQKPKRTDNIGFVVVRIPLFFRGHSGNT